MGDISLLDVNEQIDFLKVSGIHFNYVCEKNAKDYLEQNNNLYELTKYCDNYDKYVEGKNIGKYVNLDFKYLIELLEIDRIFRHVLLGMVLDLELWLKRDITKRCREHCEDGYGIVKEYIDHLDLESLDILRKELKKDSEDLNFSLSEFLDVAMFGRLIGFYNYLSGRYHDKNMKKCYFLLRECKKIRNLCAHNELLFILHSKKIQNNSNDVLKWISTFSILKRHKKMSYGYIKEMITVFYCYKIYLRELDDHKENLIVLKNKINENSRLFEKNNRISTTFDFFNDIIDNVVEN